MEQSATANPRKDQRSGGRLRIFSKNTPSYHLVYSLLRLDLARLFDLAFPLFELFDFDLLPPDLSLEPTFLLLLDDDSFFATLLSLPSTLLGFVFGTAYNLVNIAARLE